jgi:photosystem II stability/assembly factor-like uncharacterized protein
LGKKVLGFLFLAMIVNLSKLTLILAFCVASICSLSAQENQSWKKLATEPYAGKQDDIFFISSKTGWYGNGAGKIYRTTDGGDSWELMATKPGTFFRCIAFVDSLNGVAGNVGTDYFPGVTDTIPLYRTSDAGRTWSPIAYKGPYVKGLCAFQVLKTKYINHGVLAERVEIFGVGRVGSPATMVYSADGGKSFQSWEVTSSQMLFDIYMFNSKKGVACGATDSDISKSNALMLSTLDGGRTWKETFRSSRPFETTWKVSFPTPKIGYTTLQSYNPDTNYSQQHFVKTTDGGQTWTEMPLVKDIGARPFGIGFINEKEGFIGTMRSGFQTKDSGKTWAKVELGKAANKFRIVPYNNRKRMYAIGVNIYRLDL